MGYPWRSNESWKEGVTRCVINELNSWDVHGDEMEGESGVTRSIIDELHSRDIQGDQTEGESGYEIAFDEAGSWISCNKFAINGLNDDVNGSVGAAEQ